MVGPSPCNFTTVKSCINKSSVVFMGAYITCFVSGRGDKLPGVSAEQNSLLVLYNVEFSIVDTVLQGILCFCWYEWLQKWELWLCISELLGEPRVAISPAITVCPPYICHPRPVWMVLQPCVCFRLVCDNKHGGGKPEILLKCGREKEKKYVEKLSWQDWKAAAVLWVALDC